MSQHHIRPITAVALALAALIGCTEPGTAEPTFALELTPRLITGQTLFDDEPSIKLVVQRPGEPASLINVGTASAGSRLELPGQPDLPAGTIIGLLAETEAGPDDEWSPSATLAYGQLTLDEDLSEGDLARALLIPGTTELAQVGSLNDAKRRMFSALAVIPGGDAYLFGGVHPDNTVRVGSNAIDTVLKMGSHDEGTFGYAVLDTVLPETDGIGDDPTTEPVDIVSDTFTGRVGLSATPFEQDGQLRVLVAGGRKWFFSTGFDTTQAVVFDPATDTIVDQVYLENPRSEHIAVPFAEGDILVVGGLVNGWVSVAGFEIFDAERGRFTRSDAVPDLAFGSLTMVGAPFGNSALVCGGADSIGLNWTVAAGCNLITPTGDVSAAPDLPIPMGGAAMAPLADGGVLIVGGFTEDYADSNTAFGSSPAISSAYRLDPDTMAWSPVGDLNTARAHHAVLPLPSGDALVVGGTSTGTGLYGALPAAVRCPELYKADSQTFELLPCTNAGQGAYVRAAMWPGEHLIAIEGFTVDFGYFSGGAHGIMGVGPDLP